MQPEAAVHPARRHHAELHALRVREPERGHHPRVVRRHPEQLPRQPGIGRVSDQHDRQGEAERDAQQLQRRQAEGAPLVDRPQREHEMDRERAVQQHGAGRARPDLDREFERGFGGLERNEPERVVDQVRGDVGEEHEAGGEPQAPPHRAGGQVRNQSVAPHRRLVWRGARRRLRSYTQSGAMALIACETSEGHLMSPRHPAWRLQYHSTGRVRCAARSCTSGARDMIAGEGMETAMV